MTPFARAPTLQSSRRDAVVVYGRARRRKTTSPPPPPPLPSQQQQSDHGSETSGSRPTPRTSALTTLTYFENDHPIQLSGLKSLEHQPKAMGSGPDPPPTPPPHSRASSSSHSVKARHADWEGDDDGVRARNASPLKSKRSPATPPSQRGPPTPDVTPPAAMSGFIVDNGADEREPPGTTFRRRIGSLVNDRAHDNSQEKTNPSDRVQQRDAESSQTMEDKAVMARPTNVARNVTNSAAQAPAKEIPESQPPLEHSFLRNQGKTVSALIKSTRLGSLSTSAMQRTASAPSRPTRHGAQTSVSSRQASATSMNSSYTAPDAPHPDGMPKRQRTLRHVRKQSALRDPLLGDQDLIHEKTDPTLTPRPPQVARSVFSDSTSRREDCASALSNNTSRSISSNRARREIWRSGAIPVVIVPERSSSQGPRSRDASLRSASSRRSKNTTSAVSTSFRDSGPIFERRQRRDRRKSEPDRLDQRTVDFPPTIPTRSSSLSAPTSRNVSRAPSTKSTGASKVNAKNGDRMLDGPPSQPQQEPQEPPTGVKKKIAMVSQKQQPTVAPVKQQPTVASETSQQLPMSPEVKQQPPRVTSEVKVVSSPRFQGKTPLSLNAGNLALANRLHSPGFGGDDELLSPPLLPALNTPYSALSIETSATVPELSEALLVHMYQHQNSSILLVNNAGRPSVLAHRKHQELSPRMRMRRTPATEKPPTTPPLKRVKLVDAHSPLRNPREPPRPPAPPVPDPSARVRGRDRPSRPERPPRQLGLMKRATASRRRQAVEEAATATKETAGFLSRTLSLSRAARKSADEKERSNSNANSNSNSNSIADKHSPAGHAADEAYPSFEDLHVHDIYGRGDIEADMLYYPPVDNRPRRAATIAIAPSSPRRRRRRRSRSLSTSGPLIPITPPAQELAPGALSLALRVQSRQAAVVVPAPRAAELRRRRSADSFRRSTARSALTKRAPSTSSRPGRGIWRGESEAVDADAEGGVKRRFSIGGTLGGIQNIPHMIREKRREKRTQKLRLMISGPRDVRDGVGEVIQRGRAHQQPIAATHV